MRVSFYSCGNSLRYLVTLSAAATTKSMQRYWSFLCPSAGWEEIQHTNFAHPIDATEKGSQKRNRAGEL